MKRFLILGWILTLAMILNSCARGDASPNDTTDSGDTPISEETPAVTPEANTTVYPLANFAYEEITPTECEMAELSDDEVFQVLTETKWGDETVAALLTKEWYCLAAIKVDGGWRAFYEIGDDQYPYNESIKLDTFDGVFGEDGIRLYYGVGANVAENVYFTIDGEAVRCLASIDGRAVVVGDMVIDRDMISDEMWLYRALDGRLVRHNVYDELAEIFSDAIHIHARYNPNFLYKTHRGMFTIGQMMSEDGGYERYAGWFDGDAIVLMKESDMERPTYTYAPDDTPMSEEGLTWIKNHDYLGWEFVLRDPIDPTTLEGDALLSYMDEAYQAGHGVLSIYNIDSFGLYGGHVRSSDMSMYYVNGHYYSDMMNPAFPSLSAWETFMRRILSGDMVDHLMEHDTFIEVDGKLMGQDGTRGTDISMHDVGSKIVSVSDDEIIYARIVEHFTDLETEESETLEYEFHYTKGEDGWRWADLYLYH